MSAIFADQFGLLVRPEQACLAELPVPVSTISAPDAWHRLQVDGSRVLALVKRPHALRPKIVPLGPRLDDAIPLISIRHPAAYYWLV